MKERDEKKIAIWFEIRYFSWTFCHACVEVVVCSFYIGRATKCEAQLLLLCAWQRQLCLPAFSWPNNPQALKPTRRVDHFQHRNPEITLKVFVLPFLNLRMFLRFESFEKSLFGWFFFLSASKYLEEMMQNCSFINRRRSFEDDDVPISDRTLEINSHISVPCHLKQCLDLKVKKIRLLFICIFLIWIYISSGETSGLRIDCSGQSFVSYGMTNVTSLVSFIIDFLLFTCVAFIALALLSIVCHNAHRVWFHYQNINPNWNFLCRRIYLESFMAHFEFFLFFSIWIYRMFLLELKNMFSCISQKKHIHIDICIWKISSISVLSLIAKKESRIIMVPLYSFWH